MDCKEIQPVHPKGDQSWVFFGRNDAKAETPVLWPPHVKSWLFGKDFDAGRDWGQEKKGTTEDEMAGWHHWLDGRESEWTLGVGDGQGDLACCNSGGRKESDMTEWLNWTELNRIWGGNTQTKFTAWPHRHLGVFQLAQVSQWWCFDTWGWIALCWGLFCALWVVYWYPFPPPWCHSLFSHSCDDKQHL